jgi:hypothetical protein
MAAIEQRRVMSRAEARTRRPVRFPATISPLGWAFALLALARLVIRVQPLLAPGALDAPRWGDDTRLLLDALGEAAVIGLPAALALGFPAAPSRNRWLVRGVVLLALAPLARIAVSWLQERVFEIDELATDAFDPSTPLGLGLAILTLSTALVAIAGAWSLSDGLDEAGATPRRGVLLVSAIAGVAVVAATYGGYVVGNEVDMASFAVSVVSLALSAVVIALWFAIAARLAVGWADGLAPRAAWVSGATAGALLVASDLASAAAVQLGGFTAWDDPLLVVLSLMNPVAWILLATAFALGLGRGWPQRPHGYRLGLTDGE